jgi:hypothetical protein
MNVRDLPPDPDHNDESPAANPDETGDVDLPDEPDVNDDTDSQPDARIRPASDSDDDDSGIGFILLGAVTGVLLVLFGSDGQDQQDGPWVEF